MQVRQGGDKSFFIDGHDESTSNWPGNELLVWYGAECTQDVAIAVDCRGLMNACMT